MLKLGSLKLGENAPRVAVSFSDRTSAASVKKAKKTGMDIAELRIDLFEFHDEKHIAKKLALFKGIPAIATIRIKEEGGAWHWSEALRQEIFVALIPHIDAVDIELSAKDTLRKIGSLAKKRGKLLIVSYHNFETTPALARLKKIVKTAEVAGADIVKIATHAGDPKHIKILTELLTKHARKNLVVIGMGDKGAATRVTFPRLGSLFTFASATEKTAPGQMPLAQMIKMLRR